MASKTKKLKIHSLFNLKQTPPQPVELVSLSDALVAAPCSPLHRRTWPAGGLAAGSVCAEDTPVQPARLRSMEDGARTLRVDRFRSSRPLLSPCKTTRSEQPF